VTAAREKTAGRKKIPLLVKIAPDLSRQQKQDIADVVTKKAASRSDIDMSVGNVPMLHCTTLLV